MRLHECASCHHRRPPGARGLCNGCRSRCRRDHTISQWGEVKADRLAAFASLRNAGFSVKRAAWEVGVSVRTGERYAVELRDPRTEAAA
jgi:hypothetical protein